MSDQSTWDDFIGGLLEIEKRCRSQKLIDEQGNRWGVFGAKHSYLHTIPTGREVARLPDWENLKRCEYHILCGFDREEGTWGLLGSLRGAGQVLEVFKPENMPGVGPDRVKIHHQVRQVVNATDNEIADVAHRAVKEIMEINGFGPAAATRLLTLACPDRLVSVNMESVAGLRALSGLRWKTPDSLVNHYVELLKWVYKQPWFKARQPDDCWERKIWNCRAALLDAFVYEKING